MFFEKLDIVEDFLFIGTLWEILRLLASKKDVFKLKLTFFSSKANF